MKLFRSFQILLALMALTGLGTLQADVPDRIAPQGTVPNPGTQQQELANITAPAPYNVFEFVVTCAGCHGGGIDQQAGHFGNWAGSSMASAARDPVFRANQIGIELTTGNVGAGNMCMRCHSPNGWYSGRFDPTLAGDPTGATMIHSIVASTDDEGILCEACHRTMGNVTMQDPELIAVDPAYAGDPVWNMLSWIDDWPHAGGPYIDQFGDPTIPAGNPYGDTTLQINDGMAYIGKYSGSVDLYFSDIPVLGTTYTGQTYGIYPPGWPDAGLPVVNPDGSVPIHFEAPIGPPIDPVTLLYDYQAQGLSLEHPTIGDRPGLLPTPVPPGNAFLRSSEFCGTCHDLTVPILNHGMPEQRTYTEWKFSAFGPAPLAGATPTPTRCQDCHMPTMMHEYADDAPVSLNPDPVLAGWFPYGKDRNPQGGTTFHKFAGANRDLPMMMKVLYPEVDLEIAGVPTGNDIRVFPGMLSNRDSMWERTQRNSELMLTDGVDVVISQAPIEVAAGIYEVKVKVTNNAGHRIPSGYPDGRRFWVELKVSDGATPVYQSGDYDEATAELLTGPGVAFNRAQEPLIDATVANAVMVYERVTGTCVDSTGAPIFPTPSAAVPVACAPSSNLLNNFILFDNRILPAGFDYTALRQAGVKFWNYDPATMVPSEDATRYGAGENWDEITYRFSAPTGATLSARAEIYWQTHTKEFMEHLRAQDISMVRPEGPPNILNPNYPLAPTYLSDVINLGQVENDFGVNLNDNWGGIAYAAWLLTGKGAPYLVAVADTSAPDLSAVAPANLQVFPQCDTVTGVCTGGVLNPDTGLLEPYTQELTWDPVTGTDGYLVEIRYGLDEATAAWDKLAIVQAPDTGLINTALNVGKTYGYRVLAFNGAGSSLYSLVAEGITPQDTPLPPELLKFVSNTDSTITMSWFDVADNEDGFRVYRQNVPPDAAGFVLVAVAPAAPGGGVSFIDQGPLTGGTCYNYQVTAYNAFGESLPNTNGPIQMCTAAAGTPLPPSNLVATASLLSPDPPTVTLTWADNADNETGFIVERAPDVNGIPGIFAEVFRPADNTMSYIDTTVAPDTAYHYRVAAYNLAGVSAYSNLAFAVTPGQLPTAPESLKVAFVTDSSIGLVWADKSENEVGFYVERSLDRATWSRIATVDANVTAYADTGLPSKTRYYYRVQAYNQAGVSDYSNEESGKTK
jgi:hypothetical protein